MPKYIALATADLHVRNYDRIWSRHPTLTGDTAFALQQIVDIFTSHFSQQPGTLLLAGDVLDAKLHRSDAIALLSGFVDSILRLGSRVLYVQGDHEYSAPPFLAALRRDATHLHGELVDIGGASVFGLDYVPLGEAPRHLETVPPCDVFLTHQKWSDLIPHGDCQFSDIPAGRCRLLITGDYHGAFHRVEPSGLRVLSPGSVCMQDIGESPTKYVWLIDDQLQATPLLLKSRSFQVLELQTEQDVEQVVPQVQALVAAAKETLPPEIAKPILRINYPQAKYEIRRWTESAFGETCHLFYRPSAAVSSADTAEAKERQQRQQVAVTGGLAGVIRNYYGQDETIAEAAVRLAAAVDKDHEARQLFSEFQSQWSATHES